jgi:hypothetical protein
MPKGWPNKGGSVTDSPTCGLGGAGLGVALAHTGLSFVPTGPASSLFLL